MDKFTLFSTEHLTDFNIEARVYKHDDSGATVVKMVTLDPNMTFSILFKTPAINDKGITHIIEHSVLCGSDHYTTKEPFADLLRVSYQNFLNAFTMPDSTMYPISSMNAVDYLNLMKVYLDAVFLPRVRHDKYPFLQEGWRWEQKGCLDATSEDSFTSTSDDPHDAESNLCYQNMSSSSSQNTFSIKPDLTVNGVVFNEMKSSETDPLSICLRALRRALYTGTYQYEAGGISSEIEQLTYREVQDFYFSHYTPRNSVTVLYSPLSLLSSEFEVLDMYFTQQIKSAVKSDLKEGATSVLLGDPLERTTKIEVEYPIGEEDEIENNAILVCAWRMGVIDYETAFALNAVQKIFEAKEGNAFVEKLTDLKIAKTISVDFDTEYSDPTFVVFAKNADLKKIEEFEDLFQMELEKVGRDGFGLEKEIAAINSVEFEERECEDEWGTSKGVLLAMKIGEGFAHEKSDLFESFRIKKVVEKIKKNSKYFAELIQKFFIKNLRKVVVLCTPSQTLMKKMSDEEEKRHTERSQNFNEECIQKIMEEEKELKRLQNLEDSEIQKSTIPTLKISDIAKKGVDVTMERLESEKVRSVYYKENSTNGIVYFTYSFDISSLKLDEIVPATILSKLLKSFDTKSHSFLELNTLLEKYYGKIECKITSTSNKRINAAHDEANKVIPYFEITGKLLYENSKEALLLLGEVLSQIKFDQKTLEKKLKTMLSDAEYQMKEEPSKLLSVRIQSYLTGAGYLQDLTDGLSGYRKVQEYAEHVAQRGDVFLTELEKIYSSIFDTQKCSLYYSCEREKRDEMLSVFTDIGKCMRMGVIDEAKREEVGLPLKDVQNREIRAMDFLSLSNPRNEALVFPLKTNYVGFGFNFVALDFAMNSSFKGLCEIIEKLFLWDKVRVEGGAYGAWVTAQADGVFIFQSYRDPHITETLEVYKEIPKLVETMQLDKNTLEKFLIGIFAQIDMPRSPEAFLEFCKLCLQENTRENYYEVREKMFDVTPQSILETLKIIKEGIKHANVCVVGNRDAIEKRAYIYSDIIEVFKK
ncbi:hypothetical protein EIN_523990 [Entamoeba invadens IP1]|uniref:Peptidase M16C associated domain-containing protein n=1 Tax=Entamoeba invadens IP1 TaxID=370355 RepID=A0A0A1UBD8_ENTIV|nr:hypothetical protein EIN_523990 [Entamoeba invadens IP1]ELP92491.1 hypothetical protein EIN_523990 [Entamoeba invadens IP1]|eukprot:XP_004259262.1 hypothetical protein EIN_523990 [Entamoeba invadens IP1]